MDEHEHQHDPVPQGYHPESPPPGTDPAGQSLSDALRVSFRLLTVIMVLVVVAFLATGVKSIEPQQAGIVKVFGKVVGTVGQGLAYTWPYPIGEIEVVDVKEARLEVRDFWMYEAPGEELKDLDQRRPVSEGLRPGWDGALLTGDRNLVHVKLICTYAVRNPVVVRKRIADLGETVRSAVCSAALSAAAGRTADSIMLADITGFARDVQDRAQRQLDAILGAEGAIAINGIGMARPGPSWPLNARPAYEAAQRAVQEAEKTRNEAIAGAKNTLRAAAGENYVKLVGEAGLPSGGAADPNEYNLIGQYDRTRRDGDERSARELLRRIDEVLLSHQTQGEARRIIAQAQAEATATEQRVKRRVEEFKKLQPTYEKSKEFVLQRLWTDTRNRILSSDTVEKLYLPMGAGQTVLYIGRDAEVAREIMRALMKKSKEGEAKPGG